MKEKQYDPFLEDEEYDEIDIMELVRKLFRDWKLILKWCGVAIVVGLVIAFSIPKEYTVHSKMAPETISKSASGGLGSLASLAGINLASISTADAMHPDLYPDIVASTPFVVELFPIQVDFKDRKHPSQISQTDYYTYLKDYTRSPWWGAVINAPFMLLDWFMGLFQEKTEDKEEEGISRVDPERLTLKQDKMVRTIRENISLGVDKKTSVISLSVTAQDPLVAAKISQEVIDRLQTYVANYRTEKSRKDLEYYQSLYEEARQDYFASQQRYASYMDRNQDVVLQRVKTEQERLQNEMNLNYQLYNTCAQQLQAAKAKVQQETPVFTIINPPQVPLKRSRPSKFTILFVSFFLGAVLASLWILWGRDAVASFKKKDEEGTPVDSEEKAPEQP